MSLNEIVNVQITRETVAPTRAGFGIIMILAEEANFTERLRFYTDLSSVVDDVCGGSASLAYKAASAIFSQQPRVERIAIGNPQGNKIITDDAGTFTGGSIVSIINGTTVTTAWTTDKDTTLTAHAAAIQALAAVQTAVYSSGSHTITITPATGILLSVTTSTAGVTGTMTATVSALWTEDVADALGNIQTYNDSWYGIVTTSRLTADQEDIADWTETQMKIFACASSDADIIGSAVETTSIAAYLKANALARSFCIYSGYAATQFPEAACLGKILPYDPGTYTLKFKTLAGITYDNLTVTQSTTARDKNCNTYEQIGGVNIVAEGTVGEGEFLDTIIFVDWLDSEITNSVYSLLKKSLKVPYTEAGLAAVEAAIDQPCKTGQNRGGISPLAFDDEDNQIGGYYITLPTFSSIPPADKAARLLQDVKFVAFLSGAIHAVRINGTVTL